MNNQPNLEPGKTEAERFLKQPKGTLPTNTANVVKRIIILENKTAELEERQTLFIDYIGLTEPVKVEDYVWYEDENKQLFICINDQWLPIPISENSIYIYRVTNEQFAWNGADLIPMTVPLTKPAIESLIYSPRVLLNNTTIDLAIGEIFDRFETPLTGATTFTITNPKKYKGFRLKLKGGTLNTDLFSDYTENWKIGNLITDYNAIAGMILNCEIQENNNIYLFWDNQIGNINTVLETILAIEV